ncbi:TPA: hypothetical protein IAD52_01435 [Candidatus Spyradomonas excrementavium]|nr:hypothetical protein [Candidatus Spyradomonas excrementavium]
MGKAKKRNFQKIKTANSAYESGISRADAIQEIVKRINENDLSPETNDIITLFGITAEELGEAGLKYEELKALNSPFL